MKNLFKSFALIMLVATISLNASAKKTRVNNTPGVNANYSTFLAAYNAAAAGDTIYVEGTAITYVAPDTIKKKLIILGPGYFLADNDSTQANKTSAIFNTMTLGKGSDGSVVSGITFTSTLTVSDVSNIIISRNYIGSYMYLLNYYKAITNIVIKQNYIATYLQQPSNSKSASNVAVLNNYIANLYLANTSSSGVCMNNVIGYNNYLYNFEYYNNIHEYPYAYIGAGSNNNMYNNLFVSAGTNYSGNIFSVDLNAVYIGTASRSTDGQKRLKPASPAKGAGYNGVDCGMFGNNDPYVLSGIPALPHIFDAKVENIGSSGTGLPVRLKAKSQK